MGRWTQYDEDEYRLPEGFERIGYDSDTGRYYFKDNSNGSIWEGEPGAEFSEMTKISNGSGSSESALDDNDDEDDMDLEAGGGRSDGYQAVATDPNSMAYPPAKPHANPATAYRTLFPFFLIIGILLLLAWRYVIHPGLSSAAKEDKCPSFHGSEDDTKHATELYLVQPGDSCWEIARSHHCDWGLFAVINGNIDCDKLMPGTSLCLPVEPTDNAGNNTAASASDGIP